MLSKGIDVPVHSRDRPVARRAAFPPRSTARRLLSRLGGLRDGRNNPSVPVAHRSAARRMVSLLSLALIAAAPPCGNPYGPKCSVQLSTGVRMSYIDAGA